MAKKSLTHEEFEDTISSMNLAEQTKTIAYNVLVLGHKQAIYVEKFQISKGAVNQSVLRVYNEFLNRQGFYASSKRKANPNWTWYDDAEEKIIAFTKRELGYVSKLILLPVGQRQTVFLFHLWTKESTAFHKKYCFPCQQTKFINLEAHPSKCT